MKQVPLCPDHFHWYTYTIVNTNQYRITWNGNSFRVIHWAVHEIVSKNIIKPKKYILLEKEKKVFDVASAEYHGLDQYLICWQSSLIISNNSVWKNVILKMSAARKVWIRSNWKFLLRREKKPQKERKDLISIIYIFFVI